MKKVIMSESQVIKLNEINVNETPIFAKTNGKLVGMIVREKDGWILRTGGKRHHSGFYSTVNCCIDRCIEYGYDFYIE